MEIYECEEAVHEALKQPRPKRIVTMINKHLAQENPKTGKLDFVCLDCRADGPEGKARAFFSAPPPTIVFCANRLHSPRDVEETMVHELIHAYDFSVRKMDITQPELLACSEIRSARESECYRLAKVLGQTLPDVAFFRQSALWANTRCVRDHAIRSTASMFPDRAQADVDKMFSQCYADNSPFPEKSKSH